ncbi:RDD family protein [Halobacillus karajensis]|uniref:RDD family protein n=1 Tax=Halobacillus karajensis TaxID=195088 RepID=A0A024P0S8_9BACI|nr:RDD family protein [Halobacillus karajensis]CDQ19411.1 RDD family protein [Halobacillus karajensis]CDQ21874.1 RDD family protein [Halobacillus karajensis]CDQ27714.1 RDD family protein [Halobacillus karajensis]
MERAGFWSRLWALLLDGLMITIPLNLIWFMYQGEWTNNITQGWAWDIVYAAYMTILPVIWNGYVIGKRVLTIQIRKEGDQPVGLLQMFIREIIGKLFLGIATFGIASIISAFMIAFREDKRAIHDKLARTYVKNRI